MLGFGLCFFGVTGITRNLGADLPAATLGAVVFGAPVDGIVLLGGAMIIGASS